MEKKIGIFDINWSLCNMPDGKFPYELEVEMHNAIHRYVRNTMSDNQDYNKARSFEYLQKILYADMWGRDYDDFMSIFTEARNMMIVFAVGVRCYDDDYIIIAFHEPHTTQINVYAFCTYNEGDIFDLYECEESED